jgi:Uma2 family endonuclease
MTLLHAPPSPTLAPEEYERLLDQPGVEFINGVVREQPLMSVEGGKVIATITALLYNAATGAGVDVFSETVSYRCFPAEPARFRRPDVSAVRSDRLVGMNLRAGSLPIPPDLAVEVVSPGDTADDVNEKIEEYVQKGFRCVWIVYLTTRTVHVFRADGSSSIFHERDEITGESLLPSFRTPVSAFFPAPTAVPRQP